MQLDVIAFQVIALDSQVFDGNWRLQVETSARGKKENNDSNQQKDRDEKE
jgi:hypothetical protein